MYLLYFIAQFKTYTERSEALSRLYNRMYQFKYTGNTVQDKTFLS